MRRALEVVCMGIFEVGFWMMDSRMDRRGARIGCIDWALVTQTRVAERV